MTDLQLGLLALGALAVAALFGYNRIQERRARGQAEAAFRSAAGDALLEPAAGRRKAAAPRDEAMGAAPLPDPRVDYVVTLGFAAPASLGALRERWKPYEHLYAKRALLAHSNDGARWLPLAQGDNEPATALQAGLQLVTREGSIGEAELIEFRAAIDTVAAATGATVSAPDLRQAVDRARELDRFCADADIQVVLHVMPAEEGGFDAERLRQLAQAEGWSLGGDGRFAACGADGSVLYSVGRRDGSAIPASGGDALLREGVSLMLDVARAPDTGRTFQAMAAAAGRLAAALGGRLVDDNGQSLDERLLAAIEAQLGGVRASFDAQGFAPGSALALRLFS